MQTEWEPDELIETWTLTGDDWDLVSSKSGATRLGFAALLKFYQVEGRFPAYREEVAPAVVRYLGSLVRVDPALFAKYPNTQLLQAVLRDPAWAGKLTEEDGRGLSPLFWSHVNPYGRFRLDMDSRLDLAAA